MPETIRLVIMNAMKTPMVETTRATRPNTTDLDHSTGRRRGTAASVERIMPVEYSPGGDQHAQDTERQLGEVRAEHGEAERGGRGVVRAQPLRRS